MFTSDCPLNFEESLTCEFKEVKSQPLQAVGKIVDRHVVAFLNAEGGSIYWGVRDIDRVVTGLKASAGLRDELRQVIGQKIAAIAPTLPLTMVEAPFHAVTNLRGEPVQDIHVLEVRVKKPKGPGLFLTGNGEAYRRTLGGLKKLSGPELLMDLSTQLGSRVKASDEEMFVARFPTVVRRSEVAAPLVAEGACYGSMTTLHGSFTSGSRWRKWGRSSTWQHLTMKVSQRGEHFAPTL
jgi:hypothetical protein